MITYHRHKQINTETFIKQIKFILNVMVLIYLIPFVGFQSAFARKGPKIEIPHMNIGDLDYKKLNFTKGIYKKASGPENCIEGEYRLMRDPQTGRVFIRAGESIFINHLDQKVVNKQDRECVLSFFNSINENNELESTEIQSCSKPINISSIRTLKIKFESDKINYVFIFKDPIKNISHKTNCELVKQ